MDEVIKRRILSKTDIAKDTLKLLYVEKEAILKNLITFSTDTPEMKTYKTRRTLSRFIPYSVSI